MEIEILGNGGGLGLGEPTTSIRVGNEVLLDAGSGLEHLGIERIRSIRRVYLTHAHLDHLSALPLLVETLFESSPVEALEVFAFPEVIDVLRSHVFNGQIWPDFEDIPERGNGFLRLREVHGGRELRDPAGFGIVPFETDHEVPSCGYALKFESGKVLAFTGDTGLSDGLLSVLNRLGPLEVLLTECSFPSRDSDKAGRFGHLTPELVNQILSGLKVPPGEVWLGHLKPRFREEIRAELEGGGFLVPSSGFRREF